MRHRRCVVVIALQAVVVSSSSHVKGGWVSGQWGRLSNKVLPYHPPGLELFEGDQIDVQHFSSYSRYWHISHWARRWPWCELIE